MKDETCRFCGESLFTDHCDRCQECGNHMKDGHTDGCYLEMYLESGKIDYKDMFEK